MPNVHYIINMKSTKIAKPSTETEALAREGFNVSKVEEDRPTQPSVKACRQGEHATG